jgi:hypothetical protein
VPNWKRKGQDLNQTGHVARRCAARSFPNAIASPGRITFSLIDLVDGHKELSRSDDKVRDAATELARRAIIVPRRILNIGECSDGKADDHSEGKNSFHRGSLPVKGF